MFSLFSRLPEEHAPGRDATPLEASTPGPFFAPGTYFENKSLVMTSDFPYEGHRSAAGG